MDLCRCGSSRSQTLSASMELFRVDVEGGLIPRRFLARLTPQSPMERSNYFIEVRRPDEDLFSTLFRPEGLSEETNQLRPHDIIVRRERQTFRRLPRTGALVFGVKTTLTALDELSMQELENLGKEVESWPEDVGKYKGRDIWGAKVLEFCRQQRAGPSVGQAAEVC